MSKRKYTIDEFIQAIKSSSSIHQVLLKLNLNATGGNYQSFHNLVNELNLDTSHMTGKGWRKNRKFEPKKELQEYLSNKFPLSSFKLKNRLLKENIFEHKCNICGLTVWLEEKIPLELHHINGNHMDNSLENLQLLCPNCHSQTTSHKGKNQKRHKEK